MKYFMYLLKRQETFYMKGHFYITHDVFVKQFARKWVLYQSERRQRCYDECCKMFKHCKDPRMTEVRSTTEKFSSFNGQCGFLLIVFRKALKNF